MVNKNSLLDKENWYIIKTKQEEFSFKVHEDQNITFKENNGFVSLYLEESFCKEKLLLVLNNFDFEHLRIVEYFSERLPFVKGSSE